jgi:nucleoside-triphosphatase
LKRAYFLTGRPGVGKTTVLVRAIENLRGEGLKIGGFISREVREVGSRVGFKLIDLESGREGWLAHVRQPSGPRVGKYRVCMRDLEMVGVDAVRRALRGADVVVIDEVGPMELHSRLFREAVLAALNSDRIILGTIHYRVRGPFIDGIRRRGDTEIIEVTPRNREELPEAIYNGIMRSRRSMTRTDRGEDQAP